MTKSERHLGFKPVDIINIKKEKLTQINRNLRKNIEMNLLLQKQPPRGVL